MTSRTVLCVDDQAPVLLMQRMLLESAGFRVVTASSGTEALAVFKSEPIDLVAMDYLMPGMKGTDIPAVMKLINPDVPIVFLSAYQELPGETLGIANAWVKKGEEHPEVFIARLRSLTDQSTKVQAHAS